MLPKLLVAPTRFELLNEIRRAHNFDPGASYEFERSTVHQGNVRNRAARRILHRDSRTARKDFFKLALLIHPARITLFRAGKAVERAALNTMNQFAGFAAAWDKVIPAAGRLGLITDIQNAISERISPMVVKKQPAIKPATSQSFLNIFDDHPNRFYAPSN